MINRTVVFQCTVFMIGLFFFLSHGRAEVLMDGLKESIEKFDEVDRNLYRGAQPDEKGFSLLKENGFVTIVNFRVEPDLIEKERQTVEALGMRYVSIPWTIYGPFRKEVWTAFKEILTDREKGPVFLHCRRGSERTGVMAGVYLMQEKGCSYEEALAYANRYDLKLIWKTFVKSKLREYADLLKQEGK